MKLRFKNFTLNKTNKKVTDLNKIQKYINIFKKKKIYTKKLKTNFDEEGEIKKIKMN